MISKEIVVSWFKGLPGDERIDLVCLLIDYCLPSEIRFIGTYLESAAQKDYFAFRTYESTANNPTDLSYLYLLEEAQVRRRLCLCLALLHSNNRQAAAVLFGNLNDFHPSCSLEGDVVAELSLLFTMASNHPAFSFHQKHVLRSKLKLLRQAATTSDLSETISDCSTGSSNFFPDIERESPSIEIPLEKRVTQNLPSCNEIIEEKTRKKEDIITEETRPVESPPIPINTPKLYVKELKVLNIQKRADCKSKHESKRKDDYEYVLEVSWSDNTIEKVHRSYEEMFDFQCKLRKMYPTKIDENGQPWKLPFLPGKIRIFNKPEHKGERTPIPDISDYSRLFASLPKFVKGCDHVLKFFQPQEKSRTRDRKSKNSKKEDKSKIKVNASKQTNTNKTIEPTNKPAESPSLLSLKDGEKNLKTTTDAKSCSKLAMKDKERVKEKDKEKNKGTEKSTTSTTAAVTATTSTSLALSWGDIVTRDENCNNIYLNENEDNTRQEFKRTEELNSVSSLASSLQGKNGFVKLNSLIKTSIAVSSSNAQTTLVPQLHCIPSPSHSPIVSPVESPRLSPAHSPTCHRRSSTGSLSWSYRSHALSVQDWLKTLRLHKYADLFTGKTFHQLLNMTDKELENVGLTAGARRKLRVNMEMLRLRGCFTSDGLTVVDLSPDFTPPDYLPHSVIPLSSLRNGYTHGYASDTELIRRASESDSASECGSDVLSEKAYSSICLPIKPAPLNGCRLSCYNCGSLGHVGGQCMAPNMDKKSNYGFHLKYDGGSSQPLPYT